MNIYRAEEEEEQDEPEAVIIKRWGGIFKELLTDADTWDLQVNKTRKFRENSLIF